VGGAENNPRGAYMSTNPALVFTDAKKRFYAARNALQSAIRNVQTVSFDMNYNWRKVVASGIPLSPTVMSGQVINFDKSKWPTGDQIVAMLSECHQAFDALERAYLSMSPTDQTALCPSGAPQP
jgi:hypothetical protein